MTRLALFGAPIAIAISILFNSGGDSGLPTNPKQADQEQAAGQDEDAELRKQEDARVADMPAGLASPELKEIASRLVSTAESSRLDWRSQYGVIEASGDGSGYCGGIIAFCSGTDDMLNVVETFSKQHPGNALAPFLPALRKVNGTDSHEGLDPGFTAAWKKSAEDPEFRATQDHVRDTLYFEPAVRQAKLDGLSPLGQYIYYDAFVVNGSGSGPGGFYGIRAAALEEEDSVYEGGDEKAYLNAFLDAARGAILAKKNKHQRDTSRIDTAQRVFLREGNLTLKTPLVWKMYGETYRIPS
ncbi:chitosanase [Streptomyces sp. DT24]|uniref:chitosanase n=1 Tax=Streptomyces sp. DT24 TaxID=3416520 RepID=UPI003CEC2940